MSDPLSSDQWEETVRESIRAGAELTPAFLLMNTLAATIASYGLFANSPAVIIGAMIVAMLLGPITGVALSLVESDKRLLLRSLITLLMGSIGVIGTGLVIGFLHLDIPITNEIMSRTAPNLIDLMVALAGGAAGAYASVSPRLSTAFVGVAIATALVPPLCSASILFAHGEIGHGSGALLLTFTNMVAIQFASSAVFWVTGFRRVSSASGLSLFPFLKRNAVSIAVLLALAVILTSSLHKSVEKQWFETMVRSTLRQSIDGSLGSHLAEVRFETAQTGAASGTTIVRAVMRGPSPPSANQVAEMEAQLPPPPDGTAVELRIRFVETKIYNRTGQLHKDVEFGTTE